MKIDAIAVYYVTKYALTKGVLEVKGSDASVYVSDGGARYLDVRTKSGQQALWVPERDFFTDLESAAMRVHQMIENKLRSLERSMRKLQTLSKECRKPVPFP